jgi:molybdopterin molybdotransferase
MSELGPSPLAAGEDQLSVNAARSAIHAAIAAQPRVLATEQLPLAQALGRVLAADVISPINVPAHDNSAMDGFAFDGAALAAGTLLTLPVLATVYAGQPLAEAVPTGSCVRIMTGAVMPANTNTVVPHELCRSGEGAVHISPGVIQPGENRRRAGEDLKQGGAALHAGRVLRPADLGLIASLGLPTVSVRRRLRVALFSTGDELREPGQALDPGCIYDSNRASLLAALQRLGVEVLDLGLVRDDPAALQAVLEQAARKCDAIVTSGGVSMGDADHTRDVLARMGQVAFWKVAMRPGRPFAFGPVRSEGDGSQPAWLFALPGNPVAALVTFYAFVREALALLAGANAETLVTLSARSPVAIRKRPGRSEFQRGIVSRAADGEWEVRTTGSQGAGILRSLSEANALLVLGHEQGSVATGERVTVWLFEGLV